MMNYCQSFWEYNEGFRCLVPCKSIVLILSIHYYSVIASIFIGNVVSFILYFYEWKWKSQEEVYLVLYMNEKYFLRLSILSNQRNLRLNMSFQKQTGVISSQIKFWKKKKENLLASLREGQNPEKQLIYLDRPNENYLLRKWIGPQWKMSTY